MLRTRINVIREQRLPFRRFVYGLPSNDGMYRLARTTLWLPLSLAARVVDEVREVRDVPGV